MPFRHLHTLVTLAMLLLLAGGLGLRGSVGWWLGLHSLKYPSASEEVKSRRPTVDMVWRLCGGCRRDLLGGTMLHITLPFSVVRLSLPAFTCLLFGGRRGGLGVLLGSAWHGFVAFAKPLLGACPRARGRCTPTICLVRWLVALWLGVARLCDFGQAVARCLPSCTGTVRPHHSFGGVGGGFVACCMLRSPVRVGSTLHAMACQPATSLRCLFVA